MLEGGVRVVCGEGRGRGVSGWCEGGLKAAGYYSVQAAEADVVSGSVAGFVDWMPSRRAQSSIGTVCRASVALITAVAWRANRLVDALARSAVTASRLSAVTRARSKPLERPTV